MAQLLDQERTRWGAFDSDLLEPLEEISRLVLAGGKRLRPVFTLVASQVGTDGPATDDAVQRG